MPNAITPSPATIKSMLVEFRFFPFGEARRPVDEQCENLTIGALRQVATNLGTPTDAQNRNKLLLRKFIIKQLHALGMIVQEGLEVFFAPALTGQPEVRADAPPGDLAANDGSPEDFSFHTKHREAMLSKFAERSKHRKAMLPGHRR